MGADTCADCKAQSLRNGQCRKMIIRLGYKRTLGQYYSDNVLLSQRGILPQKRMSWGRCAITSCIRCPPTVRPPWISLYSFHRPDSVFRKVVHPLSGFPSTSNISPESIVPENSFRMRRDSCLFHRRSRGLNTPNPDWADKEMVFAVWDYRW